MSTSEAQRFFDDLEKGEVEKKASGIQDRIRLGLEKLAKKEGYNASEIELSNELRKRWGEGSNIVYSEPPGF